MDETFIGNDRSVEPHVEKKGRGYHHKNKVLALIDRSMGKAKSLVIYEVKASTLIPIIQANVAREARPDR
ncbi:hypothetical protein SDC9_83321 [bioreactor metagenome]|uniref:Uncharacterized protein n=1 Tax=bioreactor metagenome TaxID=1076179 RepID=A0A644Z7X9_9ZZZZ